MMVPKRQNALRRLGCGIALAGLLAVIPFASAGAGAENTGVVSNALQRNGMYAAEEPLSIPPSPSQKRGNPTEEQEASDPQTLAIGIGDALLTALENNHALAIERLNPAIRRTFEDQEAASFDPVLSGDASYSRQEAEGEQANGSDAGVEVSKLFSTGTQAGIEISNDRTWSDLYGDQHTTRAGLNLRQSLLRGAGRKVNLASLRQARIDTFSSRHEFRGFVESFIADVEKTYWEYALSLRRIEIFTESLNLAEHQMKETEERIRIGVLPEIEHVAAQAEVALRKEDLINARSELAKVRLRLLRLLNPSGSGLWDREIVLQDQPAVPEVNLEGVDVHVDVGLRMRSDLNQARMQQERGDLEVVKTRNGLLPRMDFFITLGMSGYADSFSGSIEDIDGRNYDVGAGISLEYPFFNRDAKARHERAVFSSSQADESVRNLEQLVQMDVRSAYIEVNRTREQVSATAATRALQEEKMRAETEKFRVGKSTSLLVAQTQRDLVASRIAEIQAIVGYLTSLIDLYRLEGSLLERRGITLP
ncbi:MAG: TolC family protein [bacterium]